MVAADRLKAQPVPDELNWDLWQGQAAEKPFCPQRLAFRRWHEYAAGMITDWGHHHFDIAHWGMGMDDSGPLSIDAKGDLQNVDKVNGFNNIDVFAAHLKYPGDIDLWCMTVRDDKYQKSLEAGYPSRQTDAEVYADVPEQIKSETRNGVMFIGDEGRIFVNRGGLYGAAVDALKDNPLPADAQRLYVSHDHMGNLIDCMKIAKTTDLQRRYRPPQCHALPPGEYLDANPTQDHLGSDGRTNRRRRRSQGDAQPATAVTVHDWVIPVTNSPALQHSA